MAKWTKPIQTEKNTNRKCTRLKVAAKDGTTQYKKVYLQTPDERVASRRFTAIGSGWAKAGRVIFSIIWPVVRVCLTTAHVDKWGGGFTVYPRELRLLPTDPDDGATVCPECGCAWKLHDSQSPGGQGDD